MHSSSFKDQFLSSLIDAANQNRLAEELAKLSSQDLALLKALLEVENIRDFIGSPQNILGSDLTKHGEIAEQVEVGIRNAYSELRGEVPTATFESIGRTAPADYLIDGTEVQSKFVNGLNNNLKSVIDHMNKYDYFGRDGSYYHIPKDQYETILKIYKGEAVEGLSSRTQEAVRQKIAEIEAQSGQSFEEVVKPGISDYAEVQQGKVHETLDQHEDDLRQENSKRKEAIQDEHRATLAGGVKAAAVAGAVGGAIGLGSALYQKYKEGKNVFKGEFTANDWKEVGLATGKSALGGAVTGGAVYALTNCAGLAAPIAGAFVTATKGVSSLVQELNSGNINFAEFQVSAIYLAADSAGVGLATLAGQTMIPIPVVGAVIGSLAGKIVCNILMGEDRQLAKRMEKSMATFLEKLHGIEREIVEEINRRFDHIADLRAAAFDFENNFDLVVENSIKLAEAYGVEEDKILKDEEDLRSFLFK